MDFGGWRCIQAARRRARVDLCGGAIRPKHRSEAAFDPLTPAPFISPEMVQALKGLAGHVPPGMQILYDAEFWLWLE